MKKGYRENIEKVTFENTNFRKVLYTAENCQLVAMSLLPGEEIGLETHADNDQFFRFEAGVGKVIINETEHLVSAEVVVIIPKGSKHNVINTSQTEMLKLYTMYTPPHHKDGIVRATKAEAESYSPEFDGMTTE